MTAPDRLVVVADDNDDMRVLLTTVLADFELVVLDDGPAVLDQWPAHRDRAAAMVLDQRMPGLDGIEVAAAVLADRPELPVVLVSAQVDDATRIRAGAVGVRVVLSKDDLFDLADLVHDLVGD